jgi:hypothetical protein
MESASASPERDAKLADLERKRLAAEAKQRAEDETAAATKMQTITRGRTDRGLVKAKRAQIAAEAALFRPYFVAASVTDTAGGTWHLLQDGYASAAPLGWASSRHVHLFQSRYAYTFANSKRSELSDLQDVSKESYERLLAQLKGNAEGGKDKVVVEERPGAERWRPSTILDTVPFVELLVPPEKRDREHPDTTPTFRFGIPVENRLVHMGAVCGGPIDDEKLRQLKGTVLVEKELEMLFVVDETVSMAPFNQVVAQFIRNAGNLAEGRPVPVRVAVCSYTDGPPNTRVKLGEFTMVRGPQDVAALAGAVAELGDHLPDPPYDNPPERMLEGLRDALKNTKFLPGGTPFVAVVGDTGRFVESVWLLAHALGGGVSVFCLFLLFF